MTIKWNPLLPDKSRSGGWGCSCNAIKENLKMTVWSPGNDPDPRSRLTNNPLICGMLPNCLHWFAGWENSKKAKKNKPLHLQKGRKIVEGRLNHSHRNRDPSLNSQENSAFSRKGEKSILIICCGCSNLFSHSLQFACHEKPNFISFALTSE